MNEVLVTYIQQRQESQWCGWAEWVSEDGPKKTQHNTQHDTQLTTQNINHSTHSTSASRVTTSRQSTKREKCQWPSIHSIFLTSSLSSGRRKCALVRAWWIDSLNEPGSMVGWLIKALFKHRSQHKHTDRQRQGGRTWHGHQSLVKETWEACGVHSDARQANRKTGEAGNE